MRMHYARTSSRLAKLISNKGDVMNLKYLHEVLIPKREKEIKEGKNHGSRFPIYVVMDRRELYCSGHSDIGITPNPVDKNTVYGYIDRSLDADEIEFETDYDGMKEPEEITEIYYDYPTAFFLTSKEAHDYLKYQSHNLHRDAYVYIYDFGYRNYEANMLFNPNMKA